MNRLSLRINRFKFKTAGELPIVLLEEFKEYTPIQQRKTGGYQHVTGLDLQTLGSQPIIPKNLPDHWIVDLISYQQRSD
jgi:hypothetical protein